MIILAHALLLLVLFNFGAWLWIKADKQPQDISGLLTILNFKAGQSEIPACGLDSLELVGMLEEFVAFKASGKLEFVYHPATEYQLNTFSIQGVTTTHHESGFNLRSNDANSAERDLPYQIFCLGGSTTYGTFVKDNQTWPAFLDQALDSVEVLNFGVPGFVPTQETNQFIYLLKLGYRPNLFIFLDGVNIGPPYDGSDFTDLIAQRFEANNTSKGVSQWPLLQLITGSYRQDIDFFQSDGIAFTPLEKTTEYNEMIINRFVENAKIRKALAELYEIEIIQILQPNGKMNYPMEYANDFVSTYYGYDGAQLNSENLTAIYDGVLRADSSYLDWRSMFSEYGDAPLIDLVHYTPEFNLYLAEEVAASISSISMTRTESRQPATGVPFVADWITD
jgi:hypothetical protein